MSQSTQKFDNAKDSKNLSLSLNTISLGEQIAKATRRPSFTNVVEWLIWEKAVELGLVNQKPTAHKKSTSGFAIPQTYMLVAWCIAAAIATDAALKGRWDWFTFFAIGLIAVPAAYWFQYGRKSSQRG